MKIKEIEELVRGKIQNVSPEATVESIAIDSRNVTNNSLFFALKGEKNDGHNFISQAIENGAIGAVMHKKLPFPGILVEDTTQALFDLSSSIRERYPIPLIGVAGSSGKTTTKELIYLVLKEKYRVIRSEGNQNTEFSLPIMVFKPPIFDIAIAELGMRKPGDMKLLARITRPNIVVFTHLDKEHLEFFGSFSDVVKEELSIIDEIKDLEVVYNRDDENLKELKGLSYGILSDADIRGFDINVTKEGTRFKVRYPNGDIFEVKIDAFGKHIVEDVLSALAVGWLFNIPLETAIKGVEAFTPLWGRMEPIRLKNGTLIIFDGYNANPLSMRMAIETINDLDYSKKLFILADMLELGSETESSHRELGEILKNTEGDIILIGEAMINTYKLLDDRSIYFENLESALPYIKNIIYNYDVVLIKGSRGMKLERILEVLNTYEYGHGKRSTSETK
ncbi:MAG: UDP-N-acetylmuramoyl-tripeptide--D-alanyl-D-alanine ligase [bacterium]|nr:UDP-N-acetylmuramoyl-tripeptide--D-alanyl-D-alanine ligase [bacterium]